MAGPVWNVGLPAFEAPFVISHCNWIDAGLLLNPNRARLLSCLVKVLTFAKKNGGSLYERDTICPMCVWCCGSTDYG